MATNDTPKRVLLKTSPNSDAFRKEGVAAAALIPGMLIDKDAAGEFVAHPTLGAYVMPMICREEDFIGNDIDNAYGIGDTIQYDVPQRGDEYYMFLAAGEDAQDGDYLQSHGDGALMVQTGGGTPLARAIEDKDNSAGVARVRIKVEIL